MKTLRRQRRSTNPLLLLSGAIVGGIALIWLLGTVTWWTLKALPSRELSRFPKSVQHWIIPLPESAVLPSVANVDASDLLGGAQSVTSPPPLPTAVVAVMPTVIITKDPTRLAPTPTLLPQLSTRTPLPTPTKTLIPTPVPTFDPLLTAVPTQPALPPSVRVGTVTHHRQEWNNCGPATLAMGLSIFGSSETQFDTATILKPNPEDRNVTPAEMAAYVNQQTPQRALARVNGNLELIKRLLANQFPLILEIGLDPPGEVAWLEWYGHYVLADGYDEDKQQLWIYDSLIWDTIGAPSLEGQNSPEGRPYHYDELARYWPQFNNAYIVFYTPEREQELMAILGDSADEVKMWQNALTQAQEIVKADQTNAFSWFNLGTAYNWLGQSAEAAKAYDKARAIGLPWRMLWYQFGPYEAYFKMGRYEDVILLADTTLAERPFFEESFYWRGMAKKALGNLEGANADFRASADFNPYFLPAVTALATSNTP